MRHFLLHINAFVRHYWIVFALGLLLVAVTLLLALYRPKNQTVPPTLTHPDASGTPTAFLNLTFTGTAPTIPEKMWVGRVTQFDNTNDTTLLDSLIKQFQLVSSPHLDFVWNGPEYSLAFDAARNEYQLSRQLTAPTPAQPPIAASAIAGLVRAADALVTNIFPDIAFISFPDQARLLVADGEFDPATLGTATHLEIPYGPSFYQLPVLLELQPDFPLKIYVDATGLLIRLVATPFTAKFEAESQWFSLSVQEALRQIEQGNARIVSSFSETTIMPNLDKVVRGELTSAVLEYRIDPTTKLLIPYYRFDGTLVNFDNDIFSAQIITPAVRLEQ